MDYKKANQIAERIRNGENSVLYKELALMCTPYLLWVKKKYKFYCIPDDDAKRILVYEAVNDSIVPIRKNKPFTICLQNAFRNCCRDWIKNYHHKKRAKIWAEFDFNDYETAGYGGSKENLSPEVVASEGEMIKALMEELMKDGQFSREVIFRRMSGDSYAEIAEAKKKTHSECKNVFWCNFDHLKKRLTRRFRKEILDNQ